ncbi:aspartyl/asparaginyl beta-hydroxylase domain-containing protein [Actinokineospora xionganensis]|uniref:Aspartyl/asparaginyl beta-hydroxylase domain-containing protein n=1 Tax=Actinokineospora xionganensis TaxID=2684470 RepID=A0ABR7LF29_9PSEU|nr:aspartyl/asparaginyl beta-hydroxylase domain-containing protein [Actinokineospora xionganensis]MBC6451316.1 aspartyl/asparaginyl beta-hydroxylase domain-containing protein [Actinokineospora xionganensis]
MNASEHPPLSEAVRLAPSFDADRLAYELAEVTCHRWAPQRIQAPGGGVGAATAIDWRVLPLRSPGGDPDRTDPGGPGPVDFAPTEWLERLPYLREILESIPAPLNAVRLMALGSGASCQPHCDPKYTLHRGLMRLHIPLITHPGAVLVLDGVEHCWSAGQFWYGDFSREHMVRNTGPVTRVHAVIDALLTRELAEMFPQAWQAALNDGDVLFNRATSQRTRFPVVLPYATALPSGFTDFAHDQPLDGPLQPWQVAVTGRQVNLIADDRVLALVPAGPDGEYRFAGWSEQRTLQIAADGVLLRARRGRATHERHLPSTANTR